MLSGSLLDLGRLLAIGQLKRHGQTSNSEPHSLRILVLDPHEYKTNVTVGTLTWDAEIECANADHPLFEECLCSKYNWFYLLLEYLGVVHYRCFNSFSTLSFSAADNIG